jgi:uncharacterized protein with ParB-like and HNH nuclease domain
MKATQATLEATLNSPNQYVVPLFQRYYTWTEPNWEELWESITELWNGKQNKKLFMGALVFVPRPAVTTQNPAYEVIDGQQRLTTFSILLSGLRNLAVKAKGSKLAKEIEDTCLFHPYRKGGDHYRVLPRHRDRDDFVRALIGKDAPRARIAAGLRFFEENIAALLKNDVAALRRFFRRILAGIEFVHITLDGENPYKIFRSLNSTGVELTEADLIRNFMFMHVPSGQQAEFDDEYWRKLEGYFPGKKNTADSKELSSFFRDFLMAGGEYVGKDATFEEFENRFDKSGFKPAQLVEPLLGSANLYRWIKGGNPHPEKAINHSLAKLRYLKSSTTNPLVLVLLGEHTAGKITSKELIDCIELVSGFIYRRYICGQSSRNYGEWFVAACKEKAPTIQGLKTFLEAKGFPGTKRFATELETFPLYDSPYALYTLAHLEKSFQNKESPLPGDFPFSMAALKEKVEIEHVLPQRLTPKWKTMLGKNAVDDHEQYSDTLGNLTLTGYNQGLSNHDFQTKLKGIKNTPGYQKSKYELTQSIAIKSKWRQVEIVERTGILAKKAIAIWEGPAEDSIKTDDDVSETPFRKGSVVSSLYAFLSDGEWHDSAELETLAEGETNLASRLKKLARTGKKSGAWELEQVNGKVRLVAASKAKGKGAGA